jgi:hypothetical protein
MRILQAFWLIGRGVVMLGGGQAWAGVNNQGEQT